MTGILAFNTISCKNSIGTNCYSSSNESELNNEIMPGLIINCKSCNWSWITILTVFLAP